MWVKVGKSQWEHESGAFIAKYSSFGSVMFCVYESKAEYQKTGADYKSFSCLKNAKNYTR